MTWRVLPTEVALPEHLRKQHLVVDRSGGSSLSSAHEGVGPHLKKGESDDAEKMHELQMFVTDCLLIRVQELGVFSVL